jgi:predicted transcriptional regulator
MNATVKGVMTTPVVAVRPGATFKDMAVRLHRFGVSAFPVVDEDSKVLGVVSEDDLLTRQAIRLARQARDGDEPQEADDPTAAELMTRPAVTIEPEQSLENAARLMYNCRVKRLPVIDDQGHLIGIISRADVLAVFDRTDEEVREEITNQVIVPEFLQDPRQVTVTVRAGVVTLEGRLVATDLGRQIVRRVSHVPGVVAVRDRFSYH